MDNKGIGNVKAGDQVILKDGYGAYDYTIQTVERVTATQAIVLGHRFRLKQPPTKYNYSPDWKMGWEIGDESHPARIFLATPENLAEMDEYLAELKLRLACNLVRQGFGRITFRTLTWEQIKQLTVILPALLEDEGLAKLVKEHGDENQRGN